VDADAGLARVAQRHGAGGVQPDRIEREADAFHRRLRRGFLELAAGEPERFRVIDTRPPPEEVAARIWEKVQAWRTLISRPWAGPVNALRDGK